MIQYKFNDIDPSLINKLRRKVMVHKVCNLKEFEDLDCLYNEAILEAKKNAGLPS